MLEKLEEYLIPKTVPEAVKLLRRDPPGSAVAISGAIDLHWWRLQNARRFVDTSRLGLDQIHLEPTGLHLGAATLLEDIINNKHCQKFAGGLLVTGAQGLVSMPRRQSTSLSALLINAVPVVDIIPALLALDARLVVQGQRKRTLPITQLFAGKGRTTLDRELITEIVVPKPVSKTGFAIERNALTPSDDPILSVAVTLRVERGKVAAATIAIGGGVQVPVRAFNAEREIVGKKAELGALACMAWAVAEEIQPIDDVRCSAQHRREVAKAIVRRALARAAGIAENLQGNGR